MHGHVIPYEHESRHLEITGIPAGTGFVEVSQSETTLPHHQPITVDGQPIKIEQVVSIFSPPFSILLP